MEQVETSYAEFRASNLTVGTSPVQVSSSKVRVYGKVRLSAAAGNGGTIYVGNADVSASNGYPLLAGESVNIHVDDVSKIFIVASDPGQILKWASA